MKFNLNEQFLYQQMTHLKEQVFDILSKYSEMLKKAPISQQEKIQSNLAVEARSIQLQYYDILNRFQQQHLKSNNEELQLIFNLVNDFLSRVLKQETNSNQQKLININSRCSIQSNENDFYVKSSLNENEIKEKLNQLQIQLEFQLSDENAKFPKIIFTDLLQKLYYFIHEKEEQEIKEIIYMIEKGIINLNLTQNSEIELYNYLTKITNDYQSIRDTSSSSITSTMTSSKRVFYNTALQMKNLLPENHSGKHLLVSELYQRFISQNKIKNIEQFLQDQFQQ